MENPGLSSSAQNASQYKFTQTDEISEIVSNADSDGDSFVELSNSDICEVNLPCSSSKEEQQEEIVHPVPDRGRKRKCKAILKS
jgi:hypothetical protein